MLGIILAVVLSVGMTLSIDGCSNNTDNPKPAKAVSAKAVSTYTVKEYPLERNGIKLHLDSTTQDGKKPVKISFLLTALHIHLTSSMSIIRITASRVFLPETLGNTPRMISNAIIMAASIIKSLSPK